MADIKQEAQPAWGGVGGSGKHAEELAAELLADQRFKDLMSGKSGQVAWGGVGGAGKHADDMEPQVKK